MMAAVAISQVLRDPRIWQGPRHASAQVLPTQHARLDAVLPGGGLPIGCLIEILHAFDGMQEMRLLLPLIADATRAQRHVVFVDPPYVPYAPAFAAAGVDCAHLHAIGPCGNEALWAAEQVLRSATCALVACWPRQANDRQLRRLQLAAEAGRAIGIAFRPARAAALTSPAVVRLHADAAGIAVLKCRGGHVSARRVALM
jgi:hypothetical protein